MIRTHHAIIITGFRQGTREWNGLKTLAERMLDASLTHHLRTGVFVEPHLLHWDDDLESYADQMQQQGARRVFAVGYSWGAGRGLVQFARACDSRGMVIPHVVAIDPVAHSWFAPFVALAAWTRDLFPIDLPPCVLSANVLFQRINRPMGFPVRLASGWPVESRQIVARHEHMDDHPEVQRVALAAFERFLAGVPISHRPHQPETLRP